MSKQVGNSQSQANEKSLQRKESKQELLPIDDVMHQLQKLSEQIESNPQYPLGLLKQYITLYVQHHSRSQQMFNLMCEHNMIAKLFSGLSRPIYILQTFNLLLANTQELSQLVYIFSHPLFHNYLLINVETLIPTGGSFSNLSSNTSSVLATNECIQYYIQLIKTLVMKLQSESTECTLLKLFCNSKYSYFPLLTNCILLAIKRNVKEQLVRVTAQHCILQLIGIMAKKQVGEYYLSNIHMIVFFYQVITETIEDQTTHSSTQDTTIKYLVDLLKAIAIFQSQEAKDKSFLLFFSIFSNLLVFKFMKNPAPALNLLLKLSNAFTQVDELHTFPAKYLTPIYFIFAKLLFNKYLNNVTLSSIILISQAISQLSQLKEINILKIIKTHYEKIPLNTNQIEVFRNSFDQEQKKKESLMYQNKFKNSILSINKQINQKKHENILKEIQKYNLDNEQFFHLKQNFYKKASNNSNNWFTNIGILFKKINVFDIASAQYMKRLAHIASVRYTNEQPILFLEQVFCPTAIYLYEFLGVRNKEKYIFGQKAEDTEKTEISFNQNRDQFLANNQLFKVILNLTELAVSQIDCIYGQEPRRCAIENLQRKYHRKLSHPGEIYFILHFRQYFQNSIFQFLCTSSTTKPRTDLSPKLINYLYKISSSLELSVSETNKTKIKAETLKLEKQLYSIIKEKGFETFCQYLENDKEKKMVQQNQPSYMQTSIFFFQKKDQHNESSNRHSSGTKKKRSIFKSFRSLSQSPSKENESFLMKQASTLKAVEFKMLYLELLRFILKESWMVSEIKSYQKQNLPLNQVFQNKFIKKYGQFSHGERQVLYSVQNIGFNSERDYECSLKVRVNIEDLSLYSQLYHQNKLILKCNIKDFNLSQPRLGQQSSKIRSTKAVSVDEAQNSKNCFLVTILPTSNTLGFSSYQKAIEFLYTINQIKFGFRETKDSSILEYLNRENEAEQ